MSKGTRTTNLSINWQPEAAAAMERRHQQNTPWDPTDVAIRKTPVAIVALSTLGMTCLLWLMLYQLISYLVF